MDTCENLSIYPTTLKKKDHICREINFHDRQSEHKWSKKTWSRKNVHPLYKAMMWVSITRDMRQ